MQTYEIAVKNRAITANSEDMALVRTSVGIDQLHVLFDSDEWLGFPVKISFAQGDDIVTQALTVTEMDGSEWAADATVTIPHEVIDMTGDISVTIQGTDANGRHIITAKSSPLSVEESGDVVIGPAPEDAPTVDEWEQAYANAVAAANAAQSAADNLSSRADQMLEDARGEIQDIIDSLYVIATMDSLGLVKVGNGLTITDDGVLSLLTQRSATFTEEDQLLLANLQRLAAYAFDTTFDSLNLLNEDVSVKPEALPTATISEKGAVMPDGVTVFVDSDGMMRADVLTHDWDGSVLTIHSASGDSSADLRGPEGTITSATASVDQTIGTPSVTLTVGGTGTERTFDFAFSGIKGERGEQGPSGYVLTQEDIETISNEIIAQYTLGDTTRY